MRTIFELRMIAEITIKNAKRMISKGAKTGKPELRGRGKWLVEYGHFLQGQTELLENESINYEEFKMKVEQYLNSELQYFGDESFQRNDVVGEYSEVPKLIKYKIDKLVYEL